MPSGYGTELIRHMGSRSLVLLSGGVDSSACVAFYRKLGYTIEALFVDYGQPARDAERAAASAIANHYSIPLQNVTCEGPPASFSGEIMGRNALLVFVALLYNPTWSGIIALGIHAGTRYYDCQKPFVDDLSRIVTGYSDGRTVLGTPFQAWSKAAIWNFCLETNVPLHLTWSCEVSPTRPCGTCLSCRDREALHARSK